MGYQYSDCSTTAREVNVTDDEQSTTITAPRLTPKRKSFFSNFERKNIKKQKIDNFAFITDEIINYFNEDDNDSNRFILINEPIKYKVLNQLAKKLLAVPATSSPVEGIFS
ncbi:unnamed protein product [Rotaria sp. Silwood2]|nr:unnamed protein product [Rotaria sp. Silwood2]CAF3080022.1 unnamed protein product [Rotaria sp. Silwood2]CAF4408995.1 unnamed protein product [Rotaria sp. Silwood2]CAF4837080.1 unnamed protein product [Rotaria sp. Silwood2]